jgi:hypothetical protein
VNVNSLRKKIEYPFKVLLSSLFFLGLLILSQEFFIRFDFTKSQKYTLNPQTQALIKRLKAPLQIYAFLPLSAPIPYQELIAQWTDFMRELQLQHQNIEVQIYDTSELESESDEILGLAKHFKIPFQKIAQQQNDQRTQKEIPFAVLLTYLNEQSILSPPESPSDIEFNFALQLKTLVDQKPKPKMAFSKGHGETDFLKSPLISRLIQRADIEQIDLSTLAPIDTKDPSQRSTLDYLNVLVIFNPQIALKADEIEQIKDFLAKGGHVLFAADYRVQILDFPNVWVLKYYGIETFFESMGLQIQSRSVVFDTKHPALARLQRDATGQSLQSNHPLYIQTQNLNLLKDLDGLICPMCPPIQIQPKASNACESILKSYPSAQIKTDLRSLDYEKDGQIGQTQSYDVMVKCSFENQGDLIVMGSANRFLSAQPKHLLAFEHLLDYLLGYDELMPLKHQNQQTAMLKQTTAQFKTNFKLVMVFGPILLLLLMQIIFHLYRYFQRSKQSKQISKNLKSKSTRDHK